ncbi:hypothetical protein DFP91_4109 [Pseudorhodoplanes sinuspersici]|nr:hypothetical protein DFP91_4109 [Pseudorhodoplanes sinuspersici]
MSSENRFALFGIMLWPRSRQSVVGRIDEKREFQTTRPRLIATGRAPTALAAFVKRPQAARSNRRYTLKLKDYFGRSMKWNGKFRMASETLVPHSVQIVK